MGYTYRAAHLSVGVILSCGLPYRAGYHIVRVIIAWGLPVVGSPYHGSDPRCVTIIKVRVQVQALFFIIHFWQLCIEQPLYRIERENVFVLGFFVRLILIGLA